MAENGSSSSLVWILLGVGCLGALVIGAVVVVFAGAGAMVAVRQQEAVHEAASARREMELARAEEEARAREAAVVEAMELADQAEAARERAERERELELRESEEQRPPPSGARPGRQVRF